MITSASPSTTRTPSSNAITKRFQSSHLDAQRLQLWVYHSHNVSRRSTVLASKWNAHHAIAKLDYSASTSQKAFPTIHVSHNLPRHLPSVRLKVHRNPEERRSLRMLRHQKRSIIAMHERQKREDQLAAIAREKRQMEVAREKEREMQSAAVLAKQTAEPALGLPSPNRPVSTTVSPPLKLKSQEKKDRRVSFGGVYTSGPPPQPNATFPITPPALPSHRVTPVSILKNPTNQSERSVGNTTEAAVSRNTSKPDKVVELLPETQHAIDIWHQVVQEAEAFRQDFAMKKLRMVMKMNINLSVNQIAASVKQVSSKINSLSHIVNQAQSSVGGVSAEAFVMMEVAQRLVRESDGSVALSRTTAFAVSAVIVGVTASVRDVEKMKNVFLGAFYAHCMYTMPSYSQKRNGEDFQQFQKRIGYKEEETAESYLERMCGCVTLFAAVLQTEHLYAGRQSTPGMTNPFSLDQGWSWLARIVNSEQRSLTPAVVFAFLEIAGYAMAKRYRRQFAKLMAMVQQAVVLGAVKTAPKGPTSRLDIFIEEFISAGCTITNAPEGRVLPASDAEFG